MEDFIKLFLSGLLSGGVIFAVIGIILHRRSKRIEAEVTHQFETQFSLFQSKRIWKDQIISALLGPLYIQFDRTKRAYDLWGGMNLYLEANIIREGNTVIRDLLLTKGHLTPPDFLEHAGKLIDHYDIWLEEFDRVSVKKESGEDIMFIFTYNFPRDSEKAFRESFRKIRGELYKLG